MTLAERLWAKVDRSNRRGCWPWTGRSTTREGYGQLRRNGSRISAHRAAFLVSHGWLPPVVRHSCDNPPCCNPLHLLPGTHTDNRTDCVTRNRHAQGIRNGRAVYSSLFVRRVHDLRAAGWLQREIAQELGMAQSHVSRILRGQNRRVG